MRSAVVTSILTVLSLACAVDVKPVEKGMGGCYQEADGGETLRTSCISIESRFQRQVDVLFVIDNSGSMGEEQGKLAAAMGAFIDGLEVRGELIDYRIAFTTTDNGNPWCSGYADPVGGLLELSACSGRLEDFTFTGTDPATVMEDVACLEHCSSAMASVHETMDETTTATDDVPRQRPWLQRVAGDSNLPDGIGESEAARCFAPQGIAGCGFESHLESLYKGLQRTQTEGEASHGFLREQAVLAIVIVTDEIDCSYRDAWEEIFDANGDKVFWEPDTEYPTSAICWNAGVACTGDPSQYDACVPGNYDVAGNTVEENDALAVLHSVARYQDIVQGFEQQKKQLYPYAEVIVSVISGVPPGFPAGEAEIPYAQAADPEFQQDYGIGPGCSSADGDALPPVRLRAFADSFGERSLYSVCDGDYIPALESVAAQIRDQMPPVCIPVCVADVDEKTAGLQVDCLVQREAPDEPKRIVEECPLVDGEYALSSENEACWYPVTDVTPDELSEECVQDGSNLELRLLRPYGDGSLEGSYFTTVCDWSDNPRGDCPNLGG